MRLSRTTEVDDVTRRIIGGSKNYDFSSDAYLTGLIARLEPLSRNMTIAINRTKAESILEEKDEKRDNELRGIFHLVQGYLYHPDETVKSSAAKIFDVVGTYKTDIVNESYATESSLIESMLTDLAAAELQSDVAGLPGLNQVIVSLRTAQDEFEQAQADYNDEKVKDSSFASATDIKKEILPVINNELIVYLTAMALAKSDEYGPFAQLTGQIIDDNNAAVKKRSKK